MSDDLIAFLNARLDEDEVAAKAASPGPWHLNAEGDTVLADDGIEVAEAFALSGNQQRATAVHIARHDPARVFREVEADRALLRIYAEAMEFYSRPGNVSHPAGEVTGLLTAILGRAAVYSDHPDCKDAWKPEALRLEDGEA